MLLLLSPLIICAAVTYLSHIFNIENRVPPALTMTGATRPDAPPTMTKATGPDIPPTMMEAGPVQ